MADFSSGDAVHAHFSIIPTQNTSRLILQYCMHKLHLTKLNSYGIRILTCLKHAH